MSSDLHKCNSTPTTGFSFKANDSRLVLIVSVILFASFLFKKYLLLATGMTIFIFSLKTYREERTLLILWMLFGCWQAIGFLNLYLSTENFFPLEKANRIDFLRNTATGFGATVSAIFVGRYLVNNKQKYVFYIALSSLIFGAVFLWLVNIESFPLLYQKKTTFLWLSFGFDDLSALAGITLLIFWFSRPPPTDLSLAFFVFMVLFVALCLGRRTTLVFCVLIFLLYALRERKIFLVVLSAIVTFFLYLAINVTSTSMRLFEPVKNQLSHEGRLELYNNFISNFDKLKFFGQNLNPSEVTTEGIASFHGIFLDAAWYGGAFGFMFVTVGFCVLFFLMAPYLRVSFSGALILAFIALGQIFGAPPFSNSMAFNVALPMIYFLSLKEIRCKKLR